MREHLNRARLRILKEIQDTPTPIPACDQHFNRLLELREQVAEDLRGLDAWLREAHASQISAASASEMLNLLPHQAGYLNPSERADLLGTSQP